MREEINNWWKQALADLRSAGNSIKSGDYYLAVFCCQQAVEKALKALCMLLKKGIFTWSFTHLSCSESKSSKRVAFWNKRPQPRVFAYEISRHC